MWPFLSPRLSRLTLPEPTTKLLLFVLFLQGSMWYPELKQVNDSVDLRIRQRYQDDRLEKQRVYQVARLRQANFLQDTSIKAQLTRQQQTGQYDWQLVGTASLGSWQSALASAQEVVPLEAAHIEWQRQQDGLWWGKLRLTVQPDQRQAVVQDFLPVNNVMAATELSQWQLLSILQQDKQDGAALLQYQSQKYWVKQGDWLPNMGRSVEAISDEKISFISTYGDVVELSIHQQGEGHG